MPVTIVMEKDLAVKVYAYLSGQSGLSPEDSLDAADSIAQAIGTPLPVKRDPVSPGPGTEPLEGNR